MCCCDPRSLFFLHIAALPDKIPEIAVLQVAGLDIAEGADQAAADMGDILGELPDQAFHPLPFEIAAAGDRTSTRDDGEGILPAQSDQFLLLDINKGTNDRLPAVIGKEFRAHRRESADIKLIEKEGLDKVVKMMAEGDLVAAEALCDVVKRTAAQAGAKGAVRGAGAAFLFNDAVAFGRFHVISEAVLLQMLFDDIGTIAGIGGVDVDRDQFVRNRRVSPQGVKGVEEGIGIFPPRDTDGNPVAGFDQGKIADRLAGQLANFMEELRFEQGSA